VTIALLGDHIFPPNARLDLARQDSLVIPDPAIGVGWSLTIPGEYYAIPYYVGFSIATGGLVATRILYVQINDADGNEVLAMPSPTTQPANTSKRYRWVGAASASYFLDAPPTHESVAPMPSVLMEPGWVLLVSALNFLAVDQIVGIRIVSIHIPTGPLVDTGRSGIVYPVPITPQPIAA
jgi:hypothetical protein